MDKNIVVSGIIEYDSDSSLEGALSLLQDNSLIEEYEGEFVWTDEVPGLEGEDVMVEGSMLIFPAIENVEFLADNLEELLEGSVRSNVKIARLGEVIELVHVKDGETVLEIVDFDELLEYFEIDAEESMDDEVVMSSQIWDEVVIWLEDEDDFEEE